MKEFFSKISKRTWVRTILVTILSVIVAFGFAGEKVAHNDGIGWDGENYLRSMQYFSELITTHGYDQYEIMRVMPWGLTNVVCEWTGLEVTKDIAMASGFLFNALALLLSVVFFFRISNLKQWKITTEMLGFSFLFFSYPVLKMVGYYPLLSDMFGMTIGIMLCYYFLADRKWALITIGLLGAFIWPTTPVVAFALAFFPRKPLPVANSEIHSNKWILRILYLFIALIPLLILSGTILQYHGHIMPAFRGVCPLTIPTAKWIIPISCICSCLYYYYLVSSFRVSFGDTIKDNFTGKSTWINYGCFLLCMIVTTGLYKFLANSNPGALTTTQTLQCITLTSMTDPFVFVENHFIYYGVGFLLVLLVWKDVAKVVMNQGMGYLFAVAIWVLFSIRPEARVSIMYYLFPLMALLMYLNTINIRSYAVGIAAIFSLLWSRFWYHINVPGIELHMVDENYDNFVDFPSQRYFMSQGHWQSHEMYALFMAITIVCLLVLWVGKRKKWYVVEN